MAKPKKYQLISIFLISCGYSSIAYFFLNFLAIKAGDGINFGIITTLLLILTALSSVIGISIFTKKIKSILIFYFPVLIFSVLGYLAAVYLFTYIDDRTAPLVFIFSSPLNLLLINIAIVFGVPASIINGHKITSYIGLKTLLAIIFTPLFYLATFALAGENYVFGLIYGFMLFILPTGLGGLLTQVIINFLELGRQKSFY